MSVYHGGYNSGDRNTKTSQVPGNSQLLARAHGGVESRAPRPQVSLQGLVYGGENSAQTLPGPQPGSQTSLPAPTLLLPWEGRPGAAGQSRGGLSADGGAASLHTRPGPSHLSSGLGSWILCSLPGDQRPLRRLPRQEMKQPPPGTWSCPQVMLSGLGSRVCIQVKRTYIVPASPPWREATSFPPEVSCQCSHWALGCGVGTREGGGDEERKVRPY